MSGLAEPDRPDPSGKSHLLHGTDEFLLTLLFVFGFLQLLTQACHLCCHPLGFRTPGPHHQSTCQPCTINRSAMHYQQVSHAQSTGHPCTINRSAMHYQQVTHAQSTGHPCTINRSAMHNQQVSHAKSADARISLHFHAKSHNPCKTIQLMQKALNYAKSINYKLQTILSAPGKIFHCLGKQGLMLNKEYSIITWNEYTGLIQSVQHHHLA